MFTLKKSRTFEWPVTVTVPDRGKHSKSSFTAVFRVLERDELQQRIAELNDPDVSASERGARMVEFLSAILVSVEGVAVEDGGDMTNRDICEALTTDTFTAPALFDAYVEGIAGRQRKN